MVPSPSRRNRHVSRALDVASIDLFYTPAVAELELPKPARDLVPRLASAPHLSRSTDGGVFARLSSSTRQTTGNKPMSRSMATQLRSKITAARASSETAARMAAEARAGYSEEHRQSLLTEWRESTSRLFERFARRDLHISRNQELSITQWQKRVAIRNALGDAVEANYAGARRPIKPHCMSHSVSLPQLRGARIADATPSTSALELDDAH